MNTEGNNLNDGTARIWTVKGGSDGGEVFIEKNDVWYKEGSSGFEKYDGEPPVAEPGTELYFEMEINAVAQRQKQNAQIGKLTWMLLEATLGEWAYGEIEAMCEQDWESSESQSETSTNDYY